MKFSILIFKWVKYFELGSSTNNVKRIGLVGGEQNITVSYEGVGGLKILRKKKFY